MYSTLDGFDIKAQNKEGVILYAQTDHRTAQEIASEPEISTLFAITRVLNCHRFAEEENYEVQYLVSETPPPFLGNVVKACKGRVLVNHQPVDTQFAEISVDVALNEAMANLARQQAKKGLTLKALWKYEKKVGKQKLDQQVNEIEYWEQVFKLAAFAGEVLRGMVGGQWQVVMDSMGVLPLTFEVRGIQSNLASKAMKFIDLGREDSIASMVESMPALVAEHGN